MMSNFDGVVCRKMKIQSLLTCLVPLCFLNNKAVKSFLLETTPSLKYHQRCHEFSTLYQGRQSRYNSIPLFAKSNLKNSLEDLRPYENKPKLWIDTDEALHLANDMSISLQQFDALYADVVVSHTLKNNHSSKQDTSFSPKMRRINAADFPSLSNFDKYVPNTGNSNSLLEMANYATSSTIRWCDLFVAELGLCPWAKASINTDHAIRLKILPLEDSDDDISLVEKMEELIRESSKELGRLAGYLPWDNVDDGSSENMKEERELIDPNVAITFIIAVPYPSSYKSKKEFLDSNEYKNNYVPQMSSMLPSDFKFSNFIDFFNDLDDDFFIEAEDFEMNQKNHDSNPPLGTFVTLAPFHPLWHFATGASENDDTDYLESVESKCFKDESIDFEKRAPFPTISVVLTKAITDAGGELATGRIGEQNEKILGELDVDHLYRMYLSKVIHGTQS